jgi:lipoprotein signal peptidase
VIRIEHFLKPNLIKLVFLVEWALFILIELLRGELESGRQILVASYPLVLFYLLACGLVVLSRRTQQLARSWKLLGVALGLALVDQFSKGLVVSFIHYQESIPVIKGWLHIAHEYNLKGSWVAEAFNLKLVVPLTLVTVVGILLGSGIGYRYYVSTHRQSVWADIAFVGLFAGAASWVFDMGVRGHILDYIQLPGVVTADLKDILVAVGAAAFFAEWIENPRVSLQWKGWRREWRELRQLVANLTHFTLEEMRRFKREMVRWVSRGPSDQG